jgi:uncharacterized BrkB/YihY/UPF0761 family membrane protein
VGVLLWLAASRGLTYYTDNFGNYDKTYGTLGGVIVFMTWIWMSSLALLVGGEIDDAIDEIRKEREGSGGQVPAAPKKEIVIVEKLIRPPSRELAIADLAKKVGEDITTLAKDHLELALEEVGTGIKSVATDAAMILLGGVVALIGLAMLCVTAVVAVEPVLPTLWLRLLLGALVYLALGSGLVWGFGHRLRGDGFHMKRSVRAGERTAHALKEQVQNG